MMVNKNHAPVCGTYCGHCEFLDKQCAGCGQVEGKPFWTEAMESGVCPIYDCCRNQKNLEHCGLCQKLPCKIFLDLRDPNMSDDEFKHSLTTRQSALKRRKAVGTERWLKETMGD